MSQRDDNLTVIEQLKKDIIPTIDEMYIRVKAIVHKDGKVTLCIYGGELVLDTYGTFTYERNTIV